MQYKLNIKIQYVYGGQNFKVWFLSKISSKLFWDYPFKYSNVPLEKNPGALYVLSAPLRIKSTNAVFILHSYLNSATLFLTTSS